MDTASIPGTVKRRGKGTWDGNMCINFTAAFLKCKVSNDKLDHSLHCVVLKGTITGDGVWRIRRKERAPVIEVFKLEEAGHGDILLDEFINWRIKLALKDHGTEEDTTAKTTLQEGGG